jgi:hypothetical protein
VSLPNYQAAATSLPRDDLDQIFDEAPLPKPEGVQMHRRQVLSLDPLSIQALHDTQWSLVSSPVSGVPYLQFSSSEPALNHHAHTCESLSLYVRNQ